jgi:hypothetical protein
VGRYPFDVELFHLLLHAGSSRRFLKIPETWPWADELAAAFHAAFALPAPT